METKSTRQVCPDCGQNFSARGLSGHRRLRHGLSPRSALPRESDRASEGITAIMGAVVGLQDAVLRIEHQLSSLRNAPAPVETPADEAARLELELADLLQRIVLLKQTGLAATTIRRPVSEIEERASLELAQMRREQARLVFRLEDLRSGRPSDDRFLS